MKQGCTGSPQFLLIVLNTIIKKLSRARIGFENEIIYILALFFADDGLLMTSLLSSMRDMIDIMQDVAKSSGLEINKNKSFV